MHASAADLHGMLKEGGRGSAGDRGGQGLRRTLVVAEVALALTLLTGAGLLVKSFARLQGVDPGFDPEHLLTFNLSLPAARYPADSQQTAFFDQVLPAIAAVPGRAGRRRHVGHAVRRELVDGQLRDRGLPAAAEDAGALGRHSHREPGLLRDAADPAPEGTVPRRGGSGRLAGAWR